MKIIKAINTILDSVDNITPIYEKIRTGSKQLPVTFKLKDRRYYPDDLFKYIVIKSSYQYFDIGTRKIKISLYESSIRHIQKEVIRCICDWVSFNHFNANPTLTVLYRWLYSQKTVSDDLFTVYKYINAYAENGYGEKIANSDIHRKNILLLLEIIRLRSQNETSN